MDIIIYFSVILAAFILQFLDASVGMGFGEITALLLLIGFVPLSVIPSVIFVSAILSLFTGWMHHDYKNVNFTWNSHSFRVAVFLVAFGIMGIIIGSVLAIDLPDFILEVYIGSLITLIGIGILINHIKKLKFSWPRLAIFGSVAGFNKGISGGGYGPVLAGGQILSGVKSKRIVGITALAEGITSSVGIIVYILIDGLSILNLPLILSLLLGGTIAIPFAVHTVKRTRSDKLRFIVGLISMLLGTMLLLKLFI